MPDAAAIKETVERYVRAVVGDVDGIVALYAEGATAEDPVGTPPHVGLDAIRAFYEASPSALSAELEEVRVAGDTAAFLFRAVVQVGDEKREVSPMDVMTFDENARIVSMRAIWSRDDVRPA